ncbi:MAG: beta-phosphoglucomutase [Herbinix sp.]|nr:beta-phosphoglucomutase [Herbinix sp.]
MKYKAIIFDLDGVICHTDQYHYLAWKQLADRLGIYFDETINNRLRGVSRDDSLDIILERYNGKPLSEEQKKALTEEKNNTYIKLLNRMTPLDLSKEVKETLEYLKTTGIKLAIGSSSKNAGLILARLGLDRCFDTISDGNNIKKSKPDPEVFTNAARNLKLNPSDCLVVEDAASGVKAAAAAGMDCAVIGDAVNCKLATYSLGTFSDIVSFI